MMDTDSTTSLTLTNVSSVSGDMTDLTQSLMDSMSENLDFVESKHKVEASGEVLNNNGDVVLGACTHRPDDKCSSVWTTSFENGAAKSEPKIVRGTENKVSGFPLPMYDPDSTCSTTSLLNMTEEPDDSSLLTMTEEPDNDRDVSDEILSSVSPNRFLPSTEANPEGRSNGINYEIPSSNSPCQLLPNPEAKPEENLKSKGVNNHSLQATMDVLKVEAKPERIYNGVNGNNPSVQATMDVLKEGNELTCQEATEKKAIKPEPSVKSRSRKMSIIRDYQPETSQCHQVLQQVMSADSHSLLSEDFRELPAPQKAITENYPQISEAYRVLPTLQNNWLQAALTGDDLGFSPHLGNPYVKSGMLLDAFSDVASEMLDRNWDDTWSSVTMNTGKMYQELERNPDLVRNPNQDQNPNSVMMQNENQTPALPKLKSETGKDQTQNPITVMIQIENQTASLSQPESGIGTSKKQGKRSRKIQRSGSSESAPERKISADSGVDVREVEDPGIVGDCMDNAITPEDDGIDEAMGGCENFTNVKNEKQDDTVNSVDKGIIADKREENDALRYEGLKQQAPPEIDICKERDIEHSSEGRDDMLGEAEPEIITKKPKQHMPDDFVLVDEGLVEPELITKKEKKHMSSRRKTRNIIHSSTWRDDMELENEGLAETEQISSRKTRDIELSSEGRDEFIDEGLAEPERITKKPKKQVSSSRKTRHKLDKIIDKLLILQTTSDEIFNIAFYTSSEKDVEGDTINNKEIGSEENVPLEGKPTTDKNVVDRGEENDFEDNRDIKVKEFAGNEIGILIEGNLPLKSKQRTDRKKQKISTFAKTLTVTKTEVVASVITDDNTVDSDKLKQQAQGMQEENEKRNSNRDGLASDQDTTDITPNNKTKSTESATSKKHPKVKSKKRRDSNLNTNNHPKFTSLDQAYPDPDMTTNEPKMVVKHHQSSIHSNTNEADHPETPKNIVVGVQQLDCLFHPTTTKLSSVEEPLVWTDPTATKLASVEEPLAWTDSCYVQLQQLMQATFHTGVYINAEIGRLNTEIEEKDGTIQKLRRRLKHLQKKYKDVTGGGTASPTSATLTSDDGDVMTQQQEHEDFMTPGQAASYGDVMVMRDGDNGGSSSFSSKSKQQHDTSANITLRRRQGAEDIVDSATNGDVSSNSRSFKSSVASVERGRHAAPEGSANRSGIPIDDFFNTSIHSESSSTHKQFTSTTSQQKSSSSSSEQQQPKHSSEIISHLRQQLQASNELNEALRRELEIYEALKLSPLSPQEDSNDIEGGPSSETTTTTTTSYHHTTTSNSSTSVHQNHPQQQPLTTTTSTSSVSSSKEQAGSTDSGLAGMTLEEHLVEIRALRLRLEESLRNNSKLRASLEERLREESSAVLADMYIQLSEKESEVERLGDELRRQGLIAEKQHQQQLSEVHRLKIELRQSEQNAARKDAKLMAINVELERREKELKATLKELKSVRNEKAVLQEQMCEEEEMNKTLKLELSVYDRLSNEHNTSIKSSKSSRSTGKDTTGKDSTGKDKGKDAAGTDLSMLMQEIRELRKQLERTIENNNLLRNKLEEQLTMANKGYFQWQQHHQQHQQQQQQTSSHTSASANSSMISQASTGHHEKKSSKASKRRPKPEQDLHDRPTEVIEPPTRDFDQLSKGSAASFSSLKSIESKEEEFCSPRQSSSWRGRGKEFSAAELSTEFVTKSQNVSDIEAMREAEWNSGLETPQIWDGELPVVTETSLFAGSTTSSISSIMRRSKLLESDTVAEKEQNGQKAHIGDVQVLKDVTSTINLHHTHHQHSSSLVSSLGSGLSRSNENRLNAEADEEDDMIASSRHSPAPRPASNLGSRYNVTDPRRPPGSDLTTAELSNGHDQATVHMRIGSDLRCLYAVGELDDHELLGKQLAESSTILSTLHNTIKHRLVEAKPQSNEYSTLRSLAVAVEQLNTLLTEQRRLTQLFWLQQLPDAGDNTAAEKQQQLEKDILRLKHKYARCKADLKAANSQLALNNARKEGYEQEIIKQLSEHHVVLQQAAINMARRNAAGSGSNPSSTTSSQH